MLIGQNKAGDSYRACAPLVIIWLTYLLVFLAY